MQDVLAVILGGGRGTRLHPLTRLRSKPAVPLAGKYRLIDIPISNCINSDLSRIFVLTQFNSASLNRHIDLTYRFDSFREGFVNILAAEQTSQSSAWFEGTADAVRKTLRHYDRFMFDHYLILSGDHIYRMDYRQMLRIHRRTHADVTVAALPVKKEKVKELGILAADADGRITKFVEKPDDPKLLKDLKVDPKYWNKFGKDKQSGEYLANMGVYVFKRKVLESILLDGEELDFGKEIFPRSVAEKKKVFSYPFEGYWEDIGTIRAFYEANLGFVKSVPSFNFYDRSAPVYTHARFLPPSKITRATTDHAILSEGCIVDEAYVRFSIIGVRSLVGQGSTIIDTIMMGSDYYETPEQIEENKKRKIPNLGIGHDCHIEGAIIDKDARIGHGVRIVAGDVPDEEGDGWMLRDGVLVVEKKAIIPDGTQLIFRK